jgi:hypothetical protein
MAPPLGGSASVRSRGIRLPPFPERLSPLAKTLHVAKPLHDQREHAPRAIITAFASMMLAPLLPCPNFRSQLCCGRSDHRKAFLSKL